MAMETVIVFAHAMGRTIVLPPEANMYLLSNGLDFHDFFHLEAMAAKHDGINIISMEVRPLLAKIYLFDLVYKLKMLSAEPFSL